VRIFPRWEGGPYLFRKVLGEEKKKESRGVQRPPGEGRSCILVEGDLCLNLADEKEGGSPSPLEGERKGNATPGGTRAVRKRRVFINNFRENPPKAKRSTL